MVSPLDKNCGDRFTYTLDGKMIASAREDTWAEKTIEKLGLNCPRLKDRRESIIKGLDNGGNGPEPTYLKEFMGITLEGKNEWPFGFYTVLLFLAEMYDIQI
ncbi:MAG: hypothetical protein GY862_10985 [Gammaproteobacteria bacterium]|nr:hypothetical protein [Gammaproteobacteria bacterium]